DLVQDDPAGAGRLPVGQDADPPVADRRVPAGLRPDGSRQGRKGGAVVDVTGNSATARYQATLEEIREAGLFKAERIITSPQAAEIVLEDGRKVLNFCANNYLGLADHPEMIRAAKDAHGPPGFATG